ncbi:MAG TPA: dihydrofolate reductase family protein [Pyrinomonadaceae bacterium]|jgi:dihydrofolate reductase|nr:dihydrofolate reductase family protein [Pyrinomonadaceae bacterium]
MRKVKYFVANSLDGFIARPDGAVDWLFMDGTDYGMSGFFKSIDTMLLGRKTYEFALAHTGSSKSKTAKSGSSKSKPVKSKNPFAGFSTYVFSRTLKDAPDYGATLVSENAGEFVRELKKQEGKDIWLMGGGGLARSLFAEGVVDEIGLNIHPLLLGAGLPLFPEIGRQIDLELLDCKAHKNGCVQVSYRVKS